MDSLAELFEYFLVRSVFLDESDAHQILQIVLGNSVHHRLVKLGLTLLDTIFRQVVLYGIVNLYF